MQQTDEWIRYWLVIDGRKNSLWIQDRFSCFLLGDVPYLVRNQYVCKIVQFNKPMSSSWTSIKGSIDNLFSCKVSSLGKKSGSLGLPVFSQVPRTYNIIKIPWVILTGGCFSISECYLPFCFLERTLWAKPSPEVIICTSWLLRAR
jgi:hypothetical protein